MNDIKKIENKKAAKTGRPKGSHNKLKETLLEVQERTKCNPFEILMNIASCNWKALGYESNEVISMRDGKPIVSERIGVNERLNAAKEACKYLFPQLKAVEMNATHDFVDQEEKRKIIDDLKEKLLKTND